MSLPFLLSVISGYIIFVILTAGSLVYGQDEEQTFESSHFSIKMTYPSDWTLIEDEEDFSPGTYDGTIYGRGAPGFAKVAEFCPTSELKSKPDISECKDSPVSVGIIMYRFLDSMSPKEFVEDETSLLNKTLAPITKLKTLDSHRTELSGLPAHQVLTTQIILSKETSARSSSIYTVNSDTGYRIFFSADDEEYYNTYLPTFQKMVNSFEILGVTEVQNKIDSTSADSTITGSEENVTLDASTNLSKEGNWTNYTNDRVGISFDYPSKWELQEKENRFDTGPDLDISDGSTRFFLIFFNAEQNGMLDSFGLDESTTTKA